MKKIFAIGSWKKEYKLALLIVFLALLAGGSWLAGSRIQSPAEAAARTAPPTPSPILVPIEERILNANVITRGAARYGLPQTVSLVPSPLKSEAGIITTLPARGEQFNEGDVLLTASERPVFLLQGEVPAYRDLYPGLSGADVHQLEAALERLSLDPGPVDGLFDEQTAAAVVNLYSAAGFDLFSATAEQLANIQTLEEKLAIAVEEKAAAREALAGATIGAEEAARRELDWLTFLVDRLSAELEAARAKAKASLPVDEIIFLSNLPVRVQEIDAAIGEAASGPLMVVTNNQLAIDSSLPLAEALLVKPGMTVAIDEPDLGIEATGTVSRIAGTPGTDGVDGYHVYFEVLVDETPATLEGFSLRLTIPVESTGGAVMVVPISALFLAPDGTSRVQVDNNGKLEFVTVEPGLSAEGYVEVTPVGGVLSPGQFVLVGYEKDE